MQDLHCLMADAYWIDSAYLIIGFCFILVAHSYNSQHQVDEVKGSEKDNDGKKYHMHGTTRCNHL